MTSRIATTHRKIGFGDCDPAQIVYYPNYFDWYDRGTHQLFEDAGVSLKVLEADLGVLTPIVDAQSRFISPARWDDNIEIESEITRWGSRSFTVTHRVSQSESGLAVAEGTEERVCVLRDPDGLGQMKACEIPSTVRSAFKID